MSDGQTTFTQQALNQVDEYICTHPDYTRYGVKQLGQGSTNRVVFARRGDELVVFKVFCEIERKRRACFAFEHWKDTGLVPLLIEDASPNMILITHIPGIYLAESRKIDPLKLWYEAIYNTGKATCALTLVPLNKNQRNTFVSQFYQPLGNLEAYLNRILTLGKRIHLLDTNFSDGFWGENLRFIQDQLPYILSQTRVLYHQDVANLHVDRGRFMGFFDLEMCRVGCAAMQLGASLGMFGGNQQAWRWFRLGWEQATNQKLSSKDFEAAIVAYYFLGWREISRYMSYDGTSGSGYSWASPADPAKYRMNFLSVAKMLGGYT